MLDEKLQPIYAHIQGVDTSLQELSPQVAQDIWETRTALQEQCHLLEQNCKTEFENVNARCYRLECAVSRLEGFIGDASFDGTSVNADRIKILEQEILKFRTHPIEESKFGQSALVGNLPPSLTIRDAEFWVKEKMQSVCSVVPETYFKGVFKGIIFMKFPSQHDRDQCVSAFAQAQFHHGENRVWITADKPVETRVQHSVLFKIKKMLVDWQFSRTSLWVDEQACTLTWNGDLVMRSNVYNDHIDAQFGGTWQDFLAEGSLESIMSNAVSILHMASVAKSKGKAKGNLNFTSALRIIDK